MDDWRVKAILGVVVAVLVGAMAWNLAFGEDDDTAPGSNAEAACRASLERQVDPLNVEHRDPGSATISRNGDQYRVKDRAAIGNDLVNYECVVNDLGDTWRVEEVNLR